MAYDKQTTTYQKQEIVYSPFDLERFDKEMAYYLTEKTLSNGEKINMYDEIQYLKDQKALSQDGAVILTNIVRDSNGHITDAVNKYRDISEKIDQWKKWKFRNEFIEKKKVEGLLELAHGMRIEN